MSTIVIPPSGEVRDKLAASMAESRYLRRLLKLAKEREEADRLSSHASKKREAPPCK